MKKLAIVFVLFLTVFSCNKKNSSAELKGKIVGFRKGTLVLNRVENDSLIPVDSISVKTTDGSFSFDLSGMEPQLMVLTVKERPGDYLAFFTDDTVITLQTTLEHFGVDKYIHGGENTRLWKDYRKILKQYNDHKLDLIEKRLKMKSNVPDSIKIKWEKEARSLEKRRKLYALNFAIRHADKPVAAYVALTEFRTNRKALDTIYNSLTPEVKNSYYGKQIRKMFASETK